MYISLRCGGSCRFPVVFVIVVVVVVAVVVGLNLLGNNNI